jgi:hypothetical protein
MEPLPLPVVLALFGSTLAFALLLDQLKVVVFRRLSID